MRRIGQFLLLAIVFCIPVIVNAQSDETIIIKNFERNYDSLLNSFYMRQNTRTIQRTYNKKREGTKYSKTVAELPDSVIARRLNALPSSIKLTYNSHVRRMIEYYIDKGGDRVGVLLGLSKYYFPIFEEILDQYNAPHELKYLAVIESALNPNAVSRAGAVGLWQFMYPTGKMYDLRANAVVDDRKDPIKSSIAAARYLRDLYKIFNDWELALAAYNCGPGNVNKAIRRSGKTTFWGIYDYLPRETRGYVPTYVAATYAMNYYKEHGIIPTELSKPIATDTVMVVKDMHFNQISSVLNIPYEQIKDLNPQYKQDIIFGTQDKYSLKLPVNYIKYFIPLEDSISNYEREKYFDPEYQQKQYQTREVQLSHKVRKGESWSSISRKYGVTWQNLKKWNGNTKYPKIGSTLKIYKKVTKEIDEDNESSKTPFNQTTVNVKKEQPKPTNNKKTITYKVRRGDSWSSIARKHGVKWQDVQKRNGNTKYPKLGQTIKIYK